MRLPVAVDYIPRKLDGEYTYTTPLKKRAKAAKYVFTICNQASPHPKMKWHITKFKPKYL